MWVTTKSEKRIFGLNRPPSLAPLGLGAGYYGWFEAQKKRGFRKGDIYRFFHRSSHAVRLYWVSKVAMGRRYNIRKENGGE